MEPDERRIDFEGYRKTRERAKKEGRFFVWSGVNVFESIHPVCGHENMLVGMALDPEWIMDMADTFSHLTVELQRSCLSVKGIRMEFGTMRIWALKSGPLCLRLCTVR